MIYKIVFDVLSYEFNICLYLNFKKITMSNLKSNKLLHCLDSKSSKMEEFKQPVIINGRGHINYNWIGKKDTLREIIL